MNLAAHDLCAEVVSHVMIVDDHPLYSDALEAALELGIEGCTIRKARTLQEALSCVEEGFAPDLVMFDLKLPDVTGISGFQRLRDALPDARILVISSLASSDLVHSLLDGGAMGFLPKDSSVKTVRDAVSEIASGRRYVPRQYANLEAAEDTCIFRTAPELACLTPQQVKILKLICEGMPNKEIAYQLSLADSTVKAHITALLRRLDVRNRTQAVVLVESVIVREGGSEPEARAFLMH